MSKFKIYAPSILIPVLLGAAVGLLTRNPEGFEMLQKPPLSPPAWLFPVAWTILYILMGVSYGLLKEKGLLDNTVKGVYYAQLAVNLIWPFLFFLLEWRLFAFIWLILLIILVIAMIAVFYKRDKAAALLQIPYLLWLVFAGYLNLAVYLLNG
ncbi:MAG: tryptophan-rich sensory protein [Ruminococcus sp.]|nr:tryptophan-rich sensory protein [Ruminococcus sp.]